MTGIILAHPRAFGSVELIKIGCPRTNYLSGGPNVTTPYLLCRTPYKLEDLKFPRRSPDLINNVKIGQGQLQLIMKHILFYHIKGLQPYWSNDLKQSNE